MSMHRLVFFIPLVVMLAACETPGPSPSPSPQLGESEVRYGRIVRIDPVALEGDHQVGLGAIIGGIAGGLLGNQIGRGTGRDVATVAGVLGGAFAGNAVQSRYAERRPGQMITVELPNGVAVTITQPADQSLRVGDAVRISGTGPDARILRQ